MAYSMWASFVCTLLLVPASLAYFFEDGFNHHYTYSADSNIFGVKNITTVLKFHIRPLNTTDNGHRLHFLEVDSIVQFTTDGLFRDNPLNWDLSKHFLFETTDDGTIDLVHFHHEDEKELVIIKKALASLFSVKVQLSDDDEWKYNTTENDHYGEMKHEYVATKTSAGMTLKRHHYSTERGHRQHEKVLHYDHRGTLHAATAQDNIVLKETQPYYKERQPEPGEFVHKVETSGDFPDIHASAQVHVKLEGKKYHGHHWYVYHGNDWTKIDGLTPGTLHTERTKERKRISQVKSDIEKYIQCVHNIPDVMDANRSACVQSLRLTLQSLHESDYRYLAESTLNRTCDPQDVKCGDIRLVFIDLVARAGDTTSQEIILNEVLNIPDPVLDEIRRVFVHCIVIMRPTPRFIQAIERFCVGEGNALHGSMNLTLTQKRACLALGSLAKNIAKEDTPEAERLVEKIETWIEKHKKVESTLRFKRSVLLTETSQTEDEYTVGRSTLIHSLGNAALKRSLPHIVAHVHPNHAHHTWKRAALTALRHYTCTESALALFESAMYDKDKTIRKMAMHQYKKHPKSKQFTAAHKDILLRQNYNYPSLVRLKRSIFDKILLDFELSIPFSWTKVIGSTSIGASFGMNFENRIRALFRPLSGFVDVNIDDRMFAEVHVGMINLHVDILLIEACYKGRLEYNMNIFKDFSVNMVKDVASAFDQMTDTMMKPMVAAANQIAGQFQDGNTRKPVFEPFATATKEIPSLTGNALDSALHLTSIAHQFSGLPWMTKFKEVVDSAQSLVEDIHSEATDFYHKIADAAMVALPLAEKEISEAASNALELVGRISNFPKQSFHALEETRLKYQLGVARMVKSNSIIREATSLLKGDRSSWMSVGSEIGNVITMLKSAHLKLTEKSRRRRGADFLATFKQQFQHDGHSVEEGMTEVQGAVDSLIAHLGLLQNHAPKTFQDASDTRELASKTIQAGLVGFKDAVEKVKSTIHGLFGNKFHKSFPSQRKGCDDTCGCGYYPTNTCKKYATPGIDLIWESDPHWTVPCPVNAMVEKQGENTLLLMPAGPDMSDYEILISNVITSLKFPKPDDEEVGVFVEAGQPIGIAAGNNGCSESHIHVAIRKKAGNNSGCFYLDPSPFLDSVKLIPKWTQKCKFFTFTHIGQIFEHGGLTKGFKKLFKQLVREAVKYAGGLIMKEILESGIIPPSLMSSVQDFVDMYKDVVDKAQNLGQLFNDVGKHMQRFFGKIEIGGISLNKAVSMLDHSGILKDKFPVLQNIVSKVDDVLNKPPAALLKTCASGLARKLLTKFHLPKIGGKSASVALIKASASKLCPSFKNGLARGFGHACSAEDDCMGVVCEIKIPFLFKAKSYKIGFKVYPDESKTVLFAGKHVKTITGKQTKDLVALGINIFGFTIKLKLTITYDHPSVDVTAIAVLCHKQKCLPDIPILKLLRFDGKVNTARPTTLTSPVPRQTYTRTYTVIIRNTTRTTSAPTSSTTATTRASTTPKTTTYTSQRTSLRQHTSRSHYKSTSTKSVTHHKQNGRHTTHTSHKPTTVRPTKHGRYAKTTFPSRHHTKHGPNTAKVLYVYEATQKPSRRHTQRPSRKQRNKKSRMRSLGKRSMAKMSRLVSSLNQKGHALIGHMNNMRHSLRAKFSSIKKKGFAKFSTEIQNPQHQTDKGNYPEPGQNSEVNINFFDFAAAFPVGPFVFIIQFKAGGALGTSFSVKVDSVSSSIKTVLTPWIAGRVEADMSVFVVIGTGGIRLVGYIMRTKFPLTLEVKYGKLPVKQIKSLDVELIPLELKLTAYLKLLFVIDIHKTLWHWRAPTLSHRIFEKITEEKNNIPPRFPSCSLECSPPMHYKNRSLAPTCTVKQLKGRHPVDTAFSLEVPTQDDTSDLTLHYSVGTHPGGQDEMTWTKMIGSTQTKAIHLSNGIPLFWTVRVRNSQGLTSFAHCKLETYDNSFPDGRVQASYEYTSHPHKLSATVVVFEDSPLLSQHNVSLGYSPGQHGREVVDDEPLYLNTTSSRSHVDNELKYFSPPRSGKMTVSPFYSTIKMNDITCAQECIAHGKKCISFDFELHSQICDLHDVIEGPKSKLRLSGSYQNYERLGVGYSSYKEYTVALEHGARYYMNAHIYNTLGYDIYLLTRGTLVDFTPPETGPVNDVIEDNVVYDGCNAAITQRCKEVTWKPNHRKIIDGQGSKTVFNGHKPLQDTLYSMANNYISANWDGFHDDESGIWGYTWAAGTEICGTNIAPFSDPFSNLASPKFWTYSGFAKDIVLPDGKYYVTTQAINSVVHGGAMVTTVCHSTPITIDTSPPIFHEVSDLLFDEDFDMMGVYYNVSDPGSGIARVDFGLGKTKYDVMIRSYTQHAFMNRANPYLVIEDLRLKPGVQAWVRLRAVNKVDLVTASHGDQPILIDRTPPIIGNVSDGDQMKVDITYQADSARICAQWIDFFDPESGIASYMWGVGRSENSDDVVQFTTFPSDVKSSCSPAILQHNTSYFSTVIAYNRALNQKNVTASSNGVLVDKTSPISGWIHDGDEVTKDMNYSSETATIKSIWGDFSDPESKIADYFINVYVNEELKGTFDIGTKTSFTDHSIATKHGDRVKLELETVNGAGLKIVNYTDGYILDETAPSLVHFDGISHVIYQSDNSSLNFKWEFVDPESRLKEYRYKINMEKGVNKHKFLPVGEDFTSIDLSTISSMENDLQLTNLSLENGAKYSIYVTAINNAMMSTVVESHGVIIDTTQPELKNIQLAMPGEEEELDDDGKCVEHIKGEELHVSWKARDPESDILESFVCLALKNDECSKDTDFRSVGTEMSTKLDGELLSVTTNATDKDQLYSVFVKVVNGAELPVIAESRQIKVIRGDVPGIVFDGRDLYDDDNFQRDKSSIAISFSGFESEACGISRYEWGVGTLPFYTDILSYTDYGLVTSNSTSGFAQIHNTNFDGVKYFASVRAKTGSNCPRDYVVSSSDGIIVDSIPPSISFSYEDNQPIDNSHYTLVNGSSTGILWKATDNVDIERHEWTMRSMPFAKEGFVTLLKTEDNRSVKKGSVVNGDTRFLTIRVVDKAGNIAEQSSAPVTYDSTPPFVNNFICSDVVSHVQPNVRCSWDVMGDIESTISHVFVSVGTGPLLSDILSRHNLSTVHRSWKRDIGDVIRNHKDKLFITLTIGNKVNLTTEMYRKVVIDETPPALGNLSIVTTIGRPQTYATQRCQIPTSFIDIAVDGFKDDQSGIDRYEAAVGSMKGGANIKDFVNVEVTSGIASLKNLHLVEGTTVFVTLRIYNKVGLYLMVSTEPVAISPNPRVHVTDGSASIDEDAQTDLTMLQGYWSYSQPCPALRVDWAIEDIAGNVFKRFEPIPDQGLHFYNDELHLENMKTYINVIRVLDAMNRTRIGRSNGISVQIQSPNPGFVNDGLGEDINFQHNADTLSANWHGFGHNNSKNPSQNIEHFEVAIGNDRRYPDSRVNVMYFQNVGLNQSGTFYNLKLTKKTNTYYITVRAYSAAGSFQEAYSNGVKVGFTGEIKPGTIECDPVQSSTDRLKASWSGIYSDIGIREYYVGISTHAQQHIGKMFLCKQIDNMDISVNIHGFVNVGLDNVHTFTDLSLSHGRSYSVVLIAHDESGRCLMMQSHPVIIDTTPPTAGKISIAGAVNDKLMYTHFHNKLTVYLDGFQDKESGVKFYDVTLEKGQQCNKGQLNGYTRTAMAKQRLIHDNSTVFNNVLLKPNQVYYISVEAYNPARLMTYVLSKPIKLDETPPSVGKVRPGSSWKQYRRFQKETDIIHATVAISHDDNSIACKADMSPNPIEIRDSEEFSKHSVIDNSEIIHLKLQHDASLKGIEKGAVIFKQIKLVDGNYKTNIKPAVGTNVYTGISYTSQDNYIHPGRLFELFYANVTECSQNSSQCFAREIRPFLQHGFNFGVLIQQSNPLGDNNTDKVTNGIMWVQDRFKLHHRAIQLNPNKEDNQFTFILHNKTVLSMASWDVEFVSDGKQEAAFSGVAMDTDISLEIFTWNANDYVPPVVDPFHPFKTEAIITNLRVPKHQKPLCMYGSPFVDHESGLKEIWIGLSDSKNKTANVVPFQRHSSFCHQCDRSCEPDCDDVCHLPPGFIPKTLEMKNLTLASASLDVQSIKSKTNTTAGFDKFHLPTYFIDIKVENHAGLVTYSKSDVVFVDTSPPNIEHVKCMDPDYSSDEPIQFLGNNKSVSVKWEAGEDVSGIVSTLVSIGTAFGKHDIREDITVYSNKSLTINGLGGRLIHMRKYFVNVKVENGAGQTSIKSCNFTMDVLPPDTAGTTAGFMFSGSVTNKGDVVMTNCTDRIGLKWDNNSIVGAQYYEWKIGSSAEGHDIFPLMRIGVKETKSVGIVAGEMRLDGIQKNPDLGEFFDRNMTNSKRIKHILKKSNFKLEPGRCVYQSLYAVSRSHLHSKIRAPPSCIKREKDKLINPGKEQVVIEENGEITTDESTNKKQKQALAFDFDVDDGGLSVGMLDQPDVQTMYGSTASANYRPFIVDPDLTAEQLSRFLKQRVISITKPMFYIAPILHVRLTQNINVTKPYDRNTLKHRTEVALLYWDSGDEMWRSMQEPCGMETRVNLKATSFETEVCGDIFNDAPLTFEKHGREKRSKKILSSPRHFMIAVISTGLRNSAPSIVTRNVEGKEDNTLEATIDFSDADGDKLTFTLKTQPSHGTANISHDGIIHYMPDPDFTGVDELEVSATEIINAPAVKPYQLSAVISITVENINDAPTLFFENSSNSLLDSKDVQAIDIEFTNEDTNHLVGTFWLTDVDSGDSLSYHKQFPDQSSTLNFSLVSPPSSDQADTPVLLGSFGTITRQQLWLNHLPNFTGSTNMSFIIVDRDNAFSRPIIIHVHVTPKIEHGLSGVIIAAIVVSGVIVLALIAAASLRYYFKSKNKIMDMSVLPDNVADGIPNVVFAHHLSELQLQTMFRLPPSKFPGNLETTAQGFTNPPKSPLPVTARDSAEMNVVQLKHELPEVDV